ncbi:MAG: AraC family transcriptional regulator ligand-binding domain-containing protein [Dongiaceae bacterium]
MSLQFKIADAACGTAGHPDLVGERPGTGELAPIALTWTTALIPLPRMLQAGGATARELLEQTGLPEIAIDHGRDLVPIAAACALLELAARRLGMTEIGPALIPEGGLASLGMLGAHVGCAEHLLEAIDRLGRHAGPHLLGVEMKLQVIGRSAIWSCSPSPAADAGRHHSAMLALGWMRQVVRSAAGPDWRADEVRIPRPGRDLERARQALGEHVLPGMAYALLFPRALLRRPMPPVPRRGDLAGASALARQQAALPADFIGSVRLLLRTFLHAGYPHLPTFARACGLSIRMLQRRFAASGTTYSKLVEQIRREEAMAMLADGRITVTEVGLELGYHESASFTRAFRRWQGLAPREYRLIACEGDGATQQVSGTN